MTRIINTPPHLWEPNTVSVCLTSGTISHKPGIFVFAVPMASLSFWPQTWLLASQLWCLVEASCTRKVFLLCSPVLSFPAQMWMNLFSSVNLSPWGMANKSQLTGWSWAFCRGWLVERSEQESEDLWGAVYEGMWSESPWGRMRLPLYPLFAGPALCFPFQWPTPLVHNLRTGRECQDLTAKG